MKYISVTLFLCIPFFIYAQSGIVTTVAGNGSSSYSGDGGSAPAAGFGVGPSGVVFYPLVPSSFPSTSPIVRKVSPSGIITTVAGTGVAGFSGDGGLATAAKLNYPTFLAVDVSDNLYIGDNNNNRVRKVNSTTGIISTFAGNGSTSFSGDGGQATAASIHKPYGLAFDYIGNLYISDYSNQRIRKVDTNGIIHTIAGTGGTYVNALSGDGGPATDAIIFIPWGLACDRHNNLYLCSNGIVRKVDVLSGFISGFAGDTIGGNRGDGGRADTAGLGTAVAISFDSIGNLFICDSHNNNVRVVDTFGIIHAVAGVGTYGYSGDGGAATAAQLGYGPRGVAVDACGNVFINDNGNFRVRKVTMPYPHAAVTLSITSNTSDTICTGMPVTYTAHSTATGTLTYQWQVNGANVGSGAASYTYNPANGDSVQCILINTAPCFTDTASSNVLHEVATTLSITLSGTTVAPIGSTVVVNATITGADSAYLIYWYNNGTLFTTTTIPTVSYTKTLATDSITAKIISASRDCNDSALSGVHVVYDHNVSVGNLQSIPNAFGSSLRLYPNPVVNILSIEAPASIESVTITNVLGQVVFQKEYNTTKISIPVTSLQSGMYFVKVNGAVARFMKQ